MWAKILYQAAFQIIIVMSIYVLGIKLYSPQAASTMAFYCINIMQLLHAVNLKTKKSIFASNIFSNKLFNLSFVLSVGLIVLVAVIPAIGAAFGLVMLSLTQWLVVALFSLSIIVFVEIAKWISKKYVMERLK